MAEMRDIDLVKSEAGSEAVSEAENVDGNLDAFLVLRDLMKPVPETEAGKLINKTMIGVVVPRVVEDMEGVADGMFADGLINWGRVVVLYAYAARVASRYGDVSKCARVVDCKTRAWIESNGGWAGLTACAKASATGEGRRKSWWERIFFFL